MYWSARPLNLPASHDFAVRTLRRQIRIGAVRPGERLPSERQLANELGIARVTLREALKVLESEGFLQIRRGAGGGAFLVDEDTLNALAFGFACTNPGSTWRGLEFLSANLGKSAELAAKRKSPTSVNKFRDAILLMSEAKTAGDVREALLIFVTGVGEASGNGFLKEAVESALEIVFFPLEKDLVPKIAARYHQSFVDFLLAIESGHVENAASLALSVSDITGELIERATTPQGFHSAIKV